MDAASLSLQLFTMCWAAFKVMDTAQSFGQDASTLHCFLALDKIRFAAWAQNSGLKDGLLDPRLNERAVEQTLAQILTLLSDAKAFHKKYELEDLLSIKSSDPHDAARDSGNAASASSSTDAESFGNLHISQYHSRLDEVRKFAGMRKVPKQLRWALTDKSKFEKICSDINNLLERLERLLDSAVWHRTANDRLLEICNYTRRTEDPAVLRGLQTAASNLYGRGSAVGSIAEGRRIHIHHSDTNGSPSGAATASNSSLELSPEQARQVQDISPSPGDSQWHLATFDGKRVYLERKSYDPSVVGASWLQTRVKALSEFLGAANSRWFKSLHCMGYFDELQDSRYTFIYELPVADSDEVTVTTLLELLSRKELIPSLSARLALAKEMASTVLYLHAAGWLHKSLRSENVLFFRQQDQMSLSAPSLMGYELARPNKNREFSDQSTRAVAADMYRHPSTLDPLQKARFRNKFDVYSLGLILIELAFWYPLEKVLCRYGGWDIVNEQHILQIQSTILSADSHILDQIRFRMGDIYCEVVKECIGDRNNTNSRDDGETEALDRFVNNVIRKLEQCVT